MPRSIGPDIETLRDQALDAIDKTAGEVRAQYLTVVPGQSDTYQYKLSDCQSWLAETNPALAGHPWVAAEAVAQDMTPTAAAQNVVATFEGWQQVGTAIEQARLTAKRLIRAAQTSADVAAQRIAGVASIRAYIP